jgi:hypothetical protein
MAAFTLLFINYHSDGYWLAFHTVLCTVIISLDATIMSATLLEVWPQLRLGIDYSNLSSTQYEVRCTRENSVSGPYALVESF